MTNIINDNKRETESTTNHTPWGIERDGSFATIRSGGGDLYTPVSFKTSSSFTYPIRPSIQRVPAKGGEQNNPLYQPHETNTQGIADNVENNYSSIDWTRNSFYNSCFGGIAPIRDLKYHDPLYLYPQQELKERKKKFYQKILNKYKKFIKE